MGRRVGGVDVKQGGKPGGGMGWRMPLERAPNCCSELVVSGMRHRPPLTAPPTSLTPPFMITSPLAPPLTLYVYPPDSMLKSQSPPTHPANLPLTTPQAPLPPPLPPAPPPTASDGGAGQGTPPATCALHRQMNEWTLHAELGGCLTLTCTPHPHNQGCTEWHNHTKAGLGWVGAGVSVLKASSYRVDGRHTGTLTGAWRRWW